MKRPKSSHSAKRRKRKHGLPPGVLVYTGDREHPTSLLTAVVYDESTYQEPPLDTTTLSKVSSEAHGRVTWIDIRGLTQPTIISQIGDRFKVHPLALEDVLDTGQRPKFEEYDDHVFVTLPSLKYHAETGQLLQEQIAFYIGASFVLSFQEDLDDTFSEVRKRLKENVGRLRRRGSDFLLYSLLDVIADHHFLTLDAMDRQVSDLEAETLTYAQISQTKQRVFEMKRLLSHFRSKLVPTRDAVYKWYRCESSVMNESTRPYARDVVDHITNVLEAVDHHKDTLSNLETLYIAETSNRLNEIMRLLTVINTIFIPLTFIVGVYGMNFTHMPELEWRYGYFVVLAVMFALSVGMLKYFRRRQWL